MSWPTDDLSTSQVDEGTDTPPRSEFYKLMQRVKTLIGGRGAANGVAELDSGGKVPASRIPQATQTETNNGTPNKFVAADKLPNYTGFDNKFFLKAGGTVSGSVSATGNFSAAGSCSAGTFVKNGEGAMPFHDNPANNSGRIVITGSVPGAGAGSPGDIWLVV